MKSFVLSFIILTSTSHAAINLETVPEVDLNRYLGKWYAVATIPTSEQKNCTAGETTEYIRDGSDRFRVVNSCYRSDGRQEITEGRARIADHESNAKFDMTFLKFIGWLWFAGEDHWIIDLDSDYNYAVVGAPSRKFVWILSRTPALDRNILQDIADTLKMKKYNPCELKMMPVNLSLAKAAPSKNLCEFIKE